MENKKNIGIGTKTNILNAEMVEIMSVRTEIAKDKQGKEIGEKVVLTCKYPTRTKPVELSQVKYLKGKTLSTSGLWLKLDEDGKILKDSALALFLTFVKAKNLVELEGMKVQTDKGDNNFLVLKGF